jgi:DNA polymerase III subunit gamma/tau
MASAARGGTRGWRAVRHLEDDGGHIWLRQAATFTVEGQTRTVEIAVPLRPGADAEEIEALLREADAGMERLSRHLDARVAALSGGAPAVEAAAPAGMTEPAGAAPAASPAATIAETPARPAAVPAREIPTAPPPPAAVPTHETPAASRARPNGPPPASPAAAARPASAPSSAPPATPSTAAPAPAEPLGIADFLAAVRREFDYNPKQAMERLSVRTLSGLNLREALEMLRRQALRDGEAVEPAPPARSTPAAPARVAPSAASVPAPTPAATTPSEPHYFEEEDDEPEMAFGLPDEDGVREDLGGYAALDGEPGDPEDDLGEFDDDDLEDVPDFAAPPPSARRAASARAATPATPQAPPPVAQPPAGSIAGGAARSQAMQIVGQLRGARAGGTPSTQQRTAYRNVVTNELGEARARALAQGVYHVAPDRLGPEQYDALISWGKRDTFAEEVDTVLAALRTERASSAAAPNGAASKPAPTAPAPPAPPVRSTNSTGATPRSGARGQSRPEGG